MLGSVPDYFDVEGFSVTVERRHNALGKLVSVSQAVVKTRIGGERVLTVAEGNGPVNALDRRLRKDLGAYRNVIADLELVDYKVRILNGGTEAVTRVLIEFERFLRRLVVHRRRVGERRRCLLRGALRFGRLQAARRRASAGRPHRGIHLPLGEAIPGLPTALESGEGARRVGKHGGAGRAGEG